MGVFSTIWGHHEYRGGILSTVGTVGNVQYPGDTIFCNLSTVEGSHDTCGGYHEYHGGGQYRGGTQVTKDCIPHGTEKPLWYS